MTTEAIALPHGPRRSRRSESTKRLILEVSAELLAQYGYEGTTLEAVAAGAGITRAAVYYHFDSKESIYAAVLHHYCVEGASRLSQLLSEVDSLASAIEVVIDHVACEATHPQRRYIYFEEIVQTDPHIHQIARDASMLLHTTVTDIITRAQTDETVVSGDPRFLATMLCTTVGRMVRWRNSTRHVPNADSVVCLKRVLLGGLLTESGRVEIRFRERFQLTCAG